MLSRPLKPGQRYRVVLDARMADHTGIGRYVRRLAERLTLVDPQLELVWLAPDGILPPSPRPDRLIPARWDDPPAIYSPREQWAVAAALAPWGADLLHVPHFNAPVLAGIPMVVTVHDLVFLHCPDECPGLAARIYAETMYRLVAARARRLLTDSRAVAEDLVATLGVAREKIVPCLLGGPPAAPPPSPEALAAARERYGLPGPYLLSVGMQRPRKNLVRLVEAFAQSGLATRGHRLVLVGPEDPRGEPVGRAIAAAGLKDAVVRPGFVPEADLAALYAGARAFAFPSLLEGFGLPAVEAFMHGIPLAASRAPALPEVCGDAAEYFDPRDVAAMARALVRVADDEPRRAELVAHGRRRLAQLSWDVTALRTAKAYRQALELPPPP